MRVSAGEREQHLPALGIVLHGFLRAMRNRPAAGKCLDATHVTAPARRTGEVHRHVSDLAGTADGSAHELTLRDDTAADSRPREDAHEIGGSATRAMDPLAER